MRKTSKRGQRIWKQLLDVRLEEGLVRPIMTPEVRQTENEQRRRHARLDIALAVNYAIQQAGGETSEMAETLSSDISASGLRLMTVAPLENGSLLNLEITLPEEWPEASEPIKAQGEVVWQSKISDFSYETGAVIKHMNELDKKRLMSFVFDQMSRLVGAFTPSGTPSDGGSSLLN